MEVGDWVKLRGTNKYRDLTKYARRTYTEAIILHHSYKPANPDASVAAIRRAHRKRGWTDIGYNGILRQGPNGPQRWAGRPPWACGAHAPGHNSRSFGLLVLGDYSEAPPAEAMLDACFHWVAELLIEYPKALVLGHREAMIRFGNEIGEKRFGEIFPGRTPETYTNCPGVDWVSGIRERLREVGLLER